MEPASFGRRGTIAMALLALVVALTLAAGSSASASHTVPVTITITEVTGIGGDLDGFGRDGPDYYTGVSIAGGPLDPGNSYIGHPHDTRDIEPFWTVHRDVVVPDDSDPVVPVVIGIWDHDDCGSSQPFCGDGDVGLLESGDDLLDVKPGSGKDITLQVNLDNGRWVSGGDVLWPTSCAQGEGDNAVRVCWDISVLSDSGDADGDGLLDGWETNGLDADGNGTIDVDLPAFGADPLHKDLFLELDWMTGHEPVRAEIQKMKTAFAAAPIDAGGTTNPDGNPGINLWVDTGSLMEGGSLVADDLGGGNSLGAPFDICNLNSDFYDTKADNFDDARRWVFRYAISARGCDEDDDGKIDSGGWGEIGGNDFIDYNHDGGTIMHELGHNLNLEHGGDEGNNCKPNYVSVMNYDNQFAIRQAGGGSIIDYSPPRFSGGRGAAPLPTLDESNLDESIILDSTDSTNQFVFVDANGNKIRNQLDQPVDWNGDGDTNDSGLSVNVNTNATGGGPAACQNGSSSETLTGHHDWDVISIPFRQFGDSANSAINPVTEPEITIDELIELEEELNTADLAVVKSDSSDPATAGEELEYTLTVTNNGPNPADDVQLVDTLPAEVSYVSDDAGCSEAGGTVTCDLGPIPADESVEVTITVLVPADLVFNNGGPVTITNEATVSNLDEFGQDPDASNNTVEEETEVVAVADLEILNFAASDAPGEILIGEPVDITLEKILTNNGPSAPMDVSVEVTATATAGATVTADAANPTEALAVELDEERAISERFTLECDAPGEQTFTFSNTIAPLNDADTDPDLTNNGAEVTVAVDCVVPVAINIHPGGSPNSVNLTGPRVVVPVAVLTTEAGEYDLPTAFDATSIDPASAVFGPEDALFDTAASGASPLHRGHIEDALELDEITRDGDLDMVLHFLAEESGLDSTDTEACVKGEFTSGSDTFTFFGCDSVRVVPSS